MPIKPENKHRYPDNWKDIRAAILERAGHACEKCKAPNRTRIAREGYASEAATGRPVLPQWRERTIALIDAALGA